MRQTLGFVAVWCTATILATSVAWLGVRDVLRSEVFEDAKIEQINTAVDRMGVAPPPSGTPTGPVAVLGTPTASAPPQRRAPTPRVTSQAPVQETIRPRATRTSPKAVSIPVRSKEPVAAEPRPFSTVPVPAPSAGVPAPATLTGSNDNVRVVNVLGGSVSFAIEGGACRLVTAAPNAGFEAKVSRAEGWIRVDLARDEHGSAVFCIGGEGRTDTWEY
ncbi:hypothetical protein ACQPYK_37450 [Streptosporangium sp. CA-135522]|uniref:hypothetical protein n=1 Tax=Streptosporangium sp. CA-135522 TaxID=3240072 RepID=UPI003D923BA3